MRFKNDSILFIFSLNTEKSLVDVENEKLNFQGI
jgi:hypothetical protein